MSIEAEASLDNPQHQGLAHTLSTEREAVRIPEAQVDAPHAIAGLAVIGDGTMGAHIIVAALEADCAVTGQTNVENVYDSLVAKGLMTTGGKAAVLARYTQSISYDAIKGIDLVIEAVFKALYRVSKLGAVRATNTPNSALTLSLPRDRRT